LPMYAAHGVAIASRMLPLAASRRRGSRARPRRIGVGLLVKIKCQIR
jgi:hypothetical protein